MPENLLPGYIKQSIQQVLQGNIAAVRYYQRWKASLQPNRNSVVDEQPWITFPVIDLLNNYINGDTKVFEYGGGGSTLFFVNRASEVVTVEHDKSWFGTLQTMISNKKINNWRGNLIEPEIASTAANLNTANPEDYYSTIGKTFKAYTTAIDKYPDNYFDIVLVDGRSRPSCIKHSIPKIKQGGLLVVDNSDRDYYFTYFTAILKKDFKLLYNKKAPSPYASFFTQTGVWMKK